MQDLTRRRRQKITISEIDFKKIISDSLDNLRDLSNAHRLDVRITLEEEFPFFSDRDQVTVIFNNLISNAIKFQHLYEMNPELLIDITVNQTKSVIRFRDNGIGIRKEDLSKVFDMFYRSEEEKSEGTGLGLYIVKEIIKKMKGRILLDSEVGEGTQFVIELPNKIDPDYLRKLERLKRDAD